MNLTTVFSVAIGCVLVYTVTLLGKDDPFKDIGEAPILGSWERVIVEPNKYNGVRISIDGWLKVRLDQVGASFDLFIDMEAMMWDRPLRSISIERESFRDLLRKGGFGHTNIDMQQFDGKYVKLDGYFEQIDDEYSVSIGELVKLSKISMVEKWGFEKKVFQ